MDTSLTLHITGPCLSAIIVEAICNCNEGRQIGLLMSTTKKSFFIDAHYPLVQLLDIDECLTSDFIDESILSNIVGLFCVRGRSGNTETETVSIYEYSLLGQLSRKLNIDKLVFGLFVPCIKNECESSPSYALQQYFYLIDFAMHKEKALPFAVLNLKGAAPAPSVSDANVNNFYEGTLDSSIDESLSVVMNTLVDVAVNPLKNVREKVLRYL